MEQETFGQLLERSLKPLEEGTVVEGTIVRIDSDKVVVDVGYKSEGEIPLSEFQDEEGRVPYRVGDRVEVLLERKENEEGMVVLSKVKADRLRAWKEINRAWEEGGVVEGRIVSRTKGGLMVDVGVPAFLPGSQVDLHPVRNFGNYIGKTFRFKVLKFDPKWGNVVLSRRVLLEEEREEQRRRLLQSLREGMVMEGVVKNITDYGAFVDLGGIDGLLHVTDMSWGRVGHPSEVVKVGQTLKVKVLHFDQERERVSLGLKQLEPDPWEGVEQKYPVGSRVHGRVVSITSYGAFVELEPGVEGLIHISEMSWTRRLRHPSQLLSVGQEVETVVLEVDAANRRISLGLKQLEPDPWTVIEQKYPVGSIVEGVVRNVTSFGIFVGVEEGIDGLVHISDLTWDRKVKHPGELYKKGDRVRAVVLNIDREGGKFSLGIKQLQPDPWEGVPERYREGQLVEGTVTNVADFGIFLEVEPGVEGLIHVSELPQGARPADFAQPGDRLRAMVLRVDPKERRMALSVKDVKQDLQQPVPEEES